MTLPISICKSDIFPFLTPNGPTFSVDVNANQRPAVVLTVKKLRQSKHMIRNKKKEKEDRI